MDQTQQLYGSRLAPFTDLADANSRIDVAERFGEGGFVLLGDVSRAWFDGSVWAVGIAGPAIDNDELEGDEDDG